MARRTKLQETPMAIATDGTLILNVAYLLDVDAAEALAEAIKMKRAIFIGVALEPSEGNKILADLDDGVADTVGRLGPRMVRRRPKR